MRLILQVSEFLLRSHMYQPVWLQSSQTNDVMNLNTLNKITNFSDYKVVGAI